MTCKFTCWHFSQKTENRKRAEKEHSSSFGIFCTKVFNNFWPESPECAFLFLDLLLSLLILNFSHQHKNKQQKFLLFLSLSTGGLLHIQTDRWTSSSVRRLGTFFLLNSSSTKSITESQWKTCTSAFENSFLFQQRFFFFFSVVVAAAAVASAWFQCWGNSRWKQNCSCKKLFFISCIAEEHAWNEIATLSCMVQCAMHNSKFAFVEAVELRQDCFIFCTGRKYQIWCSANSDNNSEDIRLLVPSPSQRIRVPDVTHLPHVD